MNYALVENEIVTNIIWLHPTNAHEFSNAVQIGEVPVSIGDSYKDGVFYRNGKRVLTQSEYLIKELNEKDAIIAELDTALLDATYENLMGGLE